MKKMIQVPYTMANLEKHRTNINLFLARIFDLLTDFQYHHKTILRRTP
jgi:hypothetical protein